MTLPELALIGLGAIAVSPVWAADTTKDQWESVGDWRYTRVAPDGKYFAYVPVGGKEDLSLGKSCFAETNTCFFVMELGLTCQAEAKYPALINSDQGTISTDLVCGKDGKHLYSSTYDNVNTLVTGATRMGIVVSTAGDEFKVVRFSLKGAAQAISKMEASVSAHHEYLQGLEDSAPSVKPAVQRL